MSHAVCNLGVKAPKFKKKIKNNILVLYTSGYTDDHIVTQGELDEGLNFIAKPYSINDIATKIRTILDTPPVD